MSEKRNGHRQFSQTNEMSYLGGGGENFNLAPSSKYSSYTALFIPAVSNFVVADFKVFGVEDVFHLAHGPLKGVRSVRGGRSLAEYYRTPAAPLPG